VLEIIFLDIDGVMNMDGSSSRTFMKPYGQHIEPHLVCRLNYICEKIKELRIVISSSWRGDMEDLKKQLEEQGFRYWNRVIGKTCKAELKDQSEKPPHDLKTSFYYINRGEQIKQWLDENKFKGRYLVIDDEISDICGERCRIIPSENILQTDSNEGMLNKDALFIVRFFND